MRFNAPVATQLYAELARIIVPEATGDAAARTAALIDYFSHLAPDLGLPTRLREVGIKQENVGQLAEDAMKQTRLLVNNPRDVTLRDASEIYGAVL
jgi:alcohol dehydrogenase class IV